MCSSCFRRGIDKYVLIFEGRQVSEQIAPPSLKYFIIFIIVIIEFGCVNVIKLHHKPLVLPKDKRLFFLRVHRLYLQE